MASLAQRVFDDTQTWSDTKRDLTFRPAKTARPRRLSQDQLAFYNTNGYLKGLRVFNDPETIAHRTYFDRLL